MKIKVKIFDEEHESDLEENVNEFLEDLDDGEFIDIKYQVSSFYDDRTQVYCFSAMIIYKEYDKDDSDED